MNKLQEKLEREFSRYQCRWGIVIKNYATGEKLTINPDMPFPSASMIKVPILYEVMRQTAAGSLSLDEMLPVTKDVRVDGAGILFELRPDIQMTIRELATLMIVLSDNTATNMLIDRIGMKAVNTTMHKLGLTSTHLRRRMMDFAAARRGEENQTTAAEMAQIFELILNSTGLPHEYSAAMLDILKRQQVRDKLPFYLPEETVLASKTGTLPGAEHDGGILYLSNGTYIISIFTADLKTNYEGLQLVARLGKIIYDHFTKED
ncbi:MAG: class A beta-lactamase-related serine hydrolase [Pelosinus sp.]|nr:class A beta-lactamase-related serine hydrolase [Pelosinus sp.]